MPLKRTVGEISPNFPKIPAFCVDLFVFVFFLCRAAEMRREFFAVCRGRRSVEFSEIFREMAQRIVADHRGNPENRVVGVGQQRAGIFHAPFHLIFDDRLAR